MKAGKCCAGVVDDLYGKVDEDGERGLIEKVGS